MDQQYTLRLENIEKELAFWLPENPGPDWAAKVFPGLGDKLNLLSLQPLIAPCRDLLGRGGKRWRPLLMNLVCEAFGGGDAALPLAPLVEFCHNASLIHDDIEDNSDERRGKPAVHLLYGVDTAINSGSFLYFLSLACIDSWAQRFNALADISPKTVGFYKAKVYELWAGVLRKLHLGQAMDIHWHRNFDVLPTPEEYYAMCGLKTGCLARFAAELGVCVSGIASDKTTPAPSVTARQTGDAAEKLGVGFQILDDVKNLTEGLPGKKRGDDITEGKKSLPVLLFLHQQPEKKEMVRRCFNAAGSFGIRAPETEELIQALAAAGVLDEAAQIGKNFISVAREVFESAGYSPLAGFTGLLN